MILLLLLLLLSCAGADLQDSATAPPLEGDPARWQQAELRCNGSGVDLTAWTTRPASAAQLDAVASPEDSPPVEVSAAMVLEFEHLSSGAQRWVYTALSADYDCVDLRQWELRLYDARGEQLDCLDQSEELC